MTIDQTMEEIRSLLDQADSLRQAGGAREHAFNLCVDTIELEEIRQKLYNLRTRIRGELPTDLWP